MNTHLPTPNYPRFHLAFPVADLGEARRFYGGLLGCAEGRSSDDWVDFDFYGHQIVAHKVGAAGMADATSLVDGQNVPVRHFGVILDVPAWQALAAKLEAAGTRVHHRAVRPFQGTARRAGDDVLPRPVRQCARVQGVRGHRTAVREEPLDRCRSSRSACCRTSPRVRWHAPEPTRRWQPQPRARSSMRMHGGSRRTAWRASSSMRRTSRTGARTALRNRRSCARGAVPF